MALSGSQNHSVFGFLSALLGIGTRCYPQESGLQTPPTRVVLKLNAGSHGHSVSVSILASQIFWGKKLAFFSDTV